MRQLDRRPSSGRRVVGGPFPLGRKLPVVTVPSPPRPIKPHENFCVTYWWFGSIWLKEHWMFGAIFQDLKHAARGMGKKPGFSAMVVLTLALGMGATTAIFSVVYGVLLRPLPYPRPDRLVSVFEVNR